MQVKRAYCFGNQDFVVGMNEDIQLVFGIRTIPSAVAKRVDFAFALILGESRFCRREVFCTTRGTPMFLAER